MKKIILLIAFTITSLTNDSFDRKNRQVFYAGENLVYSVSFFGIDLGRITMSILYDSTDSDGKKIIVAKSDLMSNNDIPYVKLDGDFYTFMNGKMTQSEKFLSFRNGTNDTLYQESFYDYENDIMKFVEYRSDKKFNEMDLEIGTKYSDGTSLYYLARNFAGLGRRIKVPTMIDTNKGLTILNLGKEVKEVEIDAVDYPISTVYMDGEALWEGIYGLKGIFKGWFSNDEAAIPIIAEMNVYVGNVKIELIEWERGDWQPPKFE